MLRVSTAMSEGRAVTVIVSCSSPSTSSGSTTRGVDLKEDVRLHERAEAGERGLQPVRSDRQAWNHVLTCVLRQYVKVRFAWTGRLTDDRDVPAWQ
jgi:hypothetical protein